MSEEIPAVEQLAIVKAFLESDAYKDALQPSAKSFGEKILPAGENIADVVVTVSRAFKLCFEPLKGLVWGSERVIDLIKETVEDRFKYKPEKMVTPDPQIAVPVLLGMQITSEKPEIRTLFFPLVQLRRASRRMRSVPFLGPQPAS